KGRAGVAVAARVPITAVRMGLDGVAPESAGRRVEADLETPVGPVTAVSVYVHTAAAGPPSMDLNHAFLERLGERLAALTGTAALLGGALTGPHAHRDIKSWKGTRGKSGFLPEEQAHPTRWRDLGWVGAGRTHAGDVDGPYTWWSWRGR